MRTRASLLISALTLTTVAGFTQPAFTRTSTRLFVENVLEGRKIASPVEPINNFILVKTVGVKEQTDEGFFIAGSSKVVKTEGQVVAVGPGKTHAETGRIFEIPLEAGDGVVYGEYDGTEIEYNGEPHMLVRDDDILVKFSGDKLTLDSVDVIRDNVLIKVDAQEQETAGGILLAAKKGEENRASTGTVVKVGGGKMAGDGSIIPMRVQLGDDVKFRDYAGNEVEIAGEEYSVVRMEDILATF